MVKRKAADILSMTFNIRYFILFIFLSLASCRNKSNLQTLGQSSNLLHCYIMFGKDEESIKYENKTILHTGVLDTTDEHIQIPSAIIKIDSNEIILNRIKYSKENNKIKEEYAGNNYLLILEYLINIDKNGELIYKGELTIQNKKLNEKYDVIGYSCNL